MREMVLGEVRAGRDYAAGGPARGARVEGAEVPRRFREQVLEQLAHVRVPLRHLEALHEVLALCLPRQLVLAGAEEAVLGQVELRDAAARRGEQVGPLQLRQR